MINKIGGALFDMLLMGAGILCVAIGVKRRINELEDEV